MTYALTVLAVLILAALTGGQFRAVRHIEDQNRALHLLIDTLTATKDLTQEELSLRLDEMERAVERLPTKWEAIKRKAENAEARARHHARRAIEELEEHGLTTPGMETVAGELFEANGEGSFSQTVPEVPPAVESSPAVDDYLSLGRARKYGD